MKEEFSNFEDATVKNSPTNSQLVELLGQPEISPDDLDGAIKAIETMSPREFPEFLENFGNLEAKRHQLPQNFFDSLVKRAFALAKEETDAYAKEHNLKPESLGGPGSIVPLNMDLDGAVNLRGDFNRQGDRLSSIDKSFLALQKLYPLFPDQADNFWQIISQNGQTIKKDLLLKGVADMNVRPDVSAYFKETSLAALNYLISFGEYRQAIADSLDFENKENFGQTARWLEFIRTLNFYSKNWNFSEDEVSPQINESLREVVKTQQGSYLLNKRAEQVLGELESGSFRGAPEDFFELSPGRKAVFYQGQLLAADPSQGERVNELIADLRELKGKFPSPSIRQNWARIWEELIANDLLKPVGLEDISLIKNSAETNSAQDFQDLIDYQSLMSQSMRQLIKRDLGADITQLDLPVQRYFLKFVQSKNAKEMEPVRSLVKTYGDNALISFLSLEQGGHEMGEKILAIGEKLEGQGAEEIFVKYSAIAEKTFNLEEKLSALLPDNSVNAEQKTRITEGLLRRAKEVLVGFADRLESGQDIKKDEVLSSLNRVSEEILLFAATFKEVSVGRDLELSELANTRVEVELASGLKPADQEAMRRFFIENRKHYTPELLKETLVDFERALKDNHNVFYSLKHGSELVSFVRFQNLPNGHAYAGSLNVRPDVKGSNIGTAFFKTLLEQRVKDQPVEGVVNARNPMAKRYVNDFAWPITGMDLNYHGTGEPFLNMTKDKAISHNFKSTQLSEQEIISLAGQKDMEGISVSVLRKDNITAELPALQELFTQGMAITRWLEKDNKIYFVCE